MCVTVSPYEKSHAYIVTNYQVFSSLLPDFIFFIGLFSVSLTWNVRWRMIDSKGCNLSYKPEFHSPVVIAVAKFGRYANTFSEWIPIAVCFIFYLTYWLVMSIVSNLMKHYAKMPIKNGSYMYFISTFWKSILLLKIESASFSFNFETVVLFYDKY